MTILNIAPATREGAHLLISLTGPSGSGKTYSAILLARGLVGEAGKIGFLDTESGRGRLYANLTRYEYGELTPPFGPTRFIQAIGEFEEAGCNALIIDSTSLEWTGSGGVLEMADATGKQGVLKWAMPKSLHKRFINRLLESRMHVICCLRAQKKIKQVPDPNNPARQVIVDDGYHEVQNDQFIFEMTISAFLHAPRQIELTKCPDELRPIFAELPINVGTGARLAEWVRGGEPVDPVFEALKRQGADIAAAGKEMFGRWWNSDPVKPQRDRLRPFLANFQSIASEADRLAAEQSRGQDVA